MAFDDRGETGNDETATPLRGLAHRLRRPADIKSVALTGLFVLAVFYTMYFMRAMLLPLVFLRPHRTDGVRRGICKLKR
jgi:hypothetical protein